MKILPCLLILGAVPLLPAVVSAKIVREVERTFAVQPGGTLRVSTQGGDVILTASATDEVRVTARQRVRATTEAEADELLEPLQLRIEQSGNEVTAEAKYEKRGSWGFFRSWPPVQVDFLVALPPRFSAELRTSGGDISVASLGGNLTARTSGGDIRLERIEGEVVASTSGGDISLREGTARAKLHTSGGDIRVDRAGGPVEASTSGGDIIIKSAPAIVRAHTSGGDVRATLTEAPSADCALGTSGGDIVVEFPRSSALRLDANTVGGNIKAAGVTLTLEKGGMGKSRLVGDVNGGGPTLKLRSSGGDIRVKASD